MGIGNERGPVHQRHPFRPINLAGDRTEKPFLRHGNIPLGTLGTLGCGNGRPTNAGILFRM